MSVVYICPTGTYVSLIAANLHVGNLLINANEKEILQTPYFGTRPSNIGMFICVGKDELGNVIYTLGTGCESQLIIKSAKDFLKINDVGQKIFFIDLSKYISKQNFWSSTLFTKLPNYKILLAKKISKSLPEINLKVEEVKKNIRQELK